MVIPNAAAIDGSVTSSWVGPTPPDEKTRSKRSESWRAVAGDVGAVVGDDLDARDDHAQLAQLAHQVARVLLLDLARQELVADEQDRRARRRRP